MQRGVFAPSKAPSEDQALLTLTCSRTHRFTQWGATLAAGGFEVCPAAISLAPSIKSGACFWEFTLFTSRVYVRSHKIYSSAAFPLSQRPRLFSFCRSKEQKDCFHVTRSSECCRSVFNIFPCVPARMSPRVQTFVVWEILWPREFDTSARRLRQRHLRCRLWMGVGCVWWFVGTNY